ncbi:zinc finger protein 366 isoform X2 [Crotalus tigris]|uniref:zinc finger protein 366 isoform X2 n=1 Tax=Crotalus tigris TaxID=88082 RepID=UPI00192F6709|nr:zinc finger protein 366 isoform X2 [Crotalus tigris]
MKKEDTHCKMDNIQAFSFAHCLDPIVNTNVAPPLSEEFRTQLAQFGYSPPTDLENFKSSLEGGSRKRKSMPMKMLSTLPPGDPTSPLDKAEENVDGGSPSLPSIFQHESTQPKYNAHMIDLCNLGYHFYRTLEHFGTQHIKEEPIKPKVLWPGPTTFLQAPYSYYPKIHPTLMFPFMMPPDLHFRNPFPLKRSLEPPFKRVELSEQAEKKQKVERVDVNIQIDDSYYIDVGGEQKRWQCPMCDKSYTSKYNLVTHILGHSGIKPHACSRCGKLFKQLSHLHTHMLTHQGTRPHKCQVCHKAFTQTSHLKRHMMQHSDIKPYSCRICGRGFAYPSELKAHESKHESGRENICIECGLDFPTLSQLKRHLTTHRGPIQYTCTECDKIFQYPSQLQNHMMKHKDIRPYICTECGMEFVQPHHLKQHSLTHKLCGKEFNRMHNLMGHMHLHSDSKPFKCLYCPSKFTLKGNLTRHMKVKHGVMERGFRSQGFAREQLSISQTDTSRSLEQEEPFDLSQKNHRQGLSFHSDREIAKQNTSHDEEDNCQRAEQYSPRMYDKGKNPNRLQDPPGETENEVKDFRESYCDGKEKKFNDTIEDKQENRREQRRGERDFVNHNEEYHFESNRFTQSLSDYLYFQHRNKSLKELLESKMESQAVFLEI